MTKKLALSRGNFAGVEGFDLCVSGDGLTHLQNAFGDDCTRRALAAVTVWARVSPQQKEYVLAGLKASGHTTLMCGDGTNDVGALKQAHVGRSSLNSFTTRSHVLTHLFLYFIPEIPGIALLTSTSKAKEPAATKPATAAALAAPAAAEKPRPTGTSSGVRLNARPVPTRSGHPLISTMRRRSVGDGGGGA
jgi:magnesium-transporting ATPase (P-type)